MIELMIVVAVVAILASIALPAYQDAVRKSRRGQAKADLVELAQRAERFSTVSNTYNGFWATVDASDQVSPREGGTAYYDIDEAITPNTFTFTATPQNGQQRDTLCGTLTITNTGAKGESGTGELSDCW